MDDVQLTLFQTEFPRIQALLTTTFQIVKRESINFSTQKKYILKNQYLKFHVLQLPRLPSGCLRKIMTNFVSVYTIFNLPNVISFLLIPSISARNIETKHERRDYKM